MGIALTASLNEVVLLFEGEKTATLATNVNGVLDLSKTSVPFLTAISSLSSTMDINKSTPEADCASSLYHLGSH